MSRPLALEWRRLADMTPSEVYALLRFRQEIFVVEQGSPYPDLDGADEAAWHLILRCEEELVGSLRLIIEVEAVRIGRVCVALSQRRRGLGRMLMDAALRFIEERYRGRDIVLSAQVAQAGFYRASGFAVVSEPYDDYGVAHLAMRRPAG